MRNRTLLGITEKDKLVSDILIDFMKIISESNRYRIIQLIFKNEEMTVSELASFLEISQPAVSQHLKILKLSSIIKHRKSGRYVLYSMDYEGLKSKYGEGIDYLRQYFLNENR